MPKRRPSLEPILAEAGASFFSKSVTQDHFEFMWHHHPEIELALVIRGRGKRYVGDSIEAFSDGDLVLLGPDLPHTWHTDPAQGTVASKVIQFLPTVFGGLIGGAPELRPIDEVLRRAKRGLRLIGGTRDDVEHLFIGIVEHPARSWRRISDLITLLGIIAQSNELVPLSSAAPTMLPNIQTGRAVDRVFELLHGPPDEIPSQAVVARNLGMSPAGFSRFFRQAVGKTYVSCVNEIRVLAACRDLLDTDRSIIDIAYRSGFGNLSNFNRRFRELKQMTPREFRQLHQNAGGNYVPAIPK